MEKPKERYVIDLTFLPPILYKNTNYKYILNIFDNFSIFLVSYLIKNKSGK